VSLVTIAGMRPVVFVSISNFQNLFSFCIMKWIKKIAFVLYYVGLVLLAVFAIKSDALKSIFSGLQSSNEGVLVQVANYFRYADTWNLIFFFMFFAAAIGLMMSLNLFYDRVFKWIVVKYPKLSFLNSSWADLTLQKGAALLSIIFLFWLGSNIIIPFQANKHIVSSIDEIPKPMPVLVLGTSKFLRNTTKENKYYTYRIDAALELFQAKKSTFFILSGDGGDGRADDYDEPRDMRDDLIAGGVPPEQIKIDTAGFRTLDSILRLRVLFKLNDIIIVSQGFHQPRSIFLSSFYGLTPYGYSAKGSATFAMIKREGFSSRPGMIMDLIFANMQPKILAPGHESYQFRESFEAKSDFHILILIGLFVLVFIMIMGFGVYQSKQGAERTKAVKKYVYGGSGIFVALVVMIASVYKNLDIKFIDEAVESIAKVVGVNTEKMEVKKVIYEQIVKKEKQKELEIIEKERELAVAVDSSQFKLEKPIEVVPEKKMNIVTISKPENQPAVRRDSVFNAVSIALPKEKEPEKKKNPFNAIKINGGKVNTASLTPTEFFTVKIHNTQPVDNESIVFLRTTDEVVLNGKTIEANTVFESRANVFNGKISFIVDKIKNVQVAGLKTFGFVDRQEGMKIEDRFYQSGKIVLSDGEPVLFNKLN
jgi:SanA protein